MKLTKDILNDIHKYKSTSYHLRDDELLKSLCSDAQNIILDNTKIEITDFPFEILRDLFVIKASRLEKNFVEDEFVIPVINVFIHYLRGDEQNGIKPGKGIMLRGPIGTGKTLLLKTYCNINEIINIIIGKNQELKIIPSYRIVDDFFKNGYDMFNNDDFKNDCWGQTHEIIIDDLGSETVINHFGNVADPVGQIILRRYDIDVRTHCSTNLGSQSLKNKYGERIFSRMKEMFNTLVLNGSDRRR